MQEVSNHIPRDHCRRLHNDAIRCIEELDAISVSVEYEIPAVTNGWVYIGARGPGGGETWVPTVDEPKQALSVHRTPTHPRSETPEKYTVEWTPSMAEKVETEEVYAAEGESYRTPLHISKRLKWECVEKAITWMEANPPGKVEQPHAAPPEPIRSSSGDPFLETPEEQESLTSFAY